MLRAICRFQHSGHYGRYIGYLIGDRIVIPADGRREHTEKVIYLPITTRSTTVQGLTWRAAFRGRTRPAANRICVLLFQQLLQNQSDGLRRMDAYPARGTGQRIVAVDGEPRGRQQPAGRS